MNNCFEVDWKELINYYNFQIKFFQHERLVHLLVTLFTSLVGLGLFVVGLFISSIVLNFLCVVFVLLSFVYIVHYYKLENGVQKLYDLYDKLTAKNNDFLQDSQSKD